MVMNIAVIMWSSGVIFIDRLIESQHIIDAKFSKTNHILVNQRLRK